MPTNVNHVSTAPTTNKILAIRDRWHTNSTRKQEAARQTGRLGGRPRKPAVTASESKSE
jgi:hypothetical protein